jgi:putative peptide zinc metalloprotease protein
VSREPFLSPSWYRVAALRPSLKTQARVRRHRFRGEVWYVVQDPASGRFHRYTPATYQVLGLLDGRRTMDEVWNAAAEQLGDDAPGQEEVIRLLSQLHAADLLQTEVSPDTAELFERSVRQSRARGRANWKNPFSIRIPLWDPDRFLARTQPFIQAVPAWTAWAVWLAVVAAGVAFTAVNWTELTENVSDRVLSAQNLLLLWLVFPVIKLLHELGHAYAVKAGGGEVHEMGILLLVFMPVPYVDATAAGGFRSKWQRAFVGAAGMVTEVFIASLCMFVWVLVEPGATRAVMFDAMLITGLSTVVFNGNPLLRYDGYYILSDLIEIPNLATRGNQYWRYLAERWLFRLRDVERPLLAPGEQGWFLFYAPAAFLYRTAVMVAIVLFIAGEWFFIGVVLALWGVATMLVWPIAKFVGYLWASPRLMRARGRAAAVSAAGIALVAVFLFAVPVPLRIQTEGVVWLPEEAIVRAGADGFVRGTLVRAGARVEAGVPLVESHDPVVAAQVRVLEARIDELEAKLDAQLFTERVQAELTRRELVREEANYRRALERAEQLIARSAVAGDFVIAQPDDLPGRFLRKGQMIGHVTQESRLLVRVVVSQDDVDLVRSRLTRADVRLAGRIAEVYPATVVREVPSAKDQLPSAALSSEGGGAVPQDPRDPKGGKALVSTFQFDLELPPGTPHAGFGGRAYVRFAHHPEPLGWQWYRRIRQAFLARFNV